MQDGFQEIPERYKKESMNIYSVMDEGSDHPSVSLTQGRDASCQLTDGYIDRRRDNRTVPWDPLNQKVPGATVTSYSPG